MAAIDPVHIALDNYSRSIAREAIGTWQQLAEEFGCNPRLAAVLRAGAWSVARMTRCYASDVDVRIAELERQFDDEEA